MKISWNKNQTAYRAVSEQVLKRFGWTNESIVVQIKKKYSSDDNYSNITELLINDAQSDGEPQYIWEHDWWEGEQDVELIAAAPVSLITLKNIETFSFKEE